MQQKQCNEFFVTKKCNLVTLWPPASLRSPWGSQQNLSRVGSSGGGAGHGQGRHGTKDCVYSQEEGVVRLPLRWVWQGADYISTKV